MKQNNYYLSVVHVIHSAHLLPVSTSQTAQSELRPSLRSDVAGHQSLITKYIKFSILITHVHFFPLISLY